MKDAMKLETQLVVAGRDKRYTQGRGESGYPARFFAGV